MIRTFRNMRLGLKLMFIIIAALKYRSVVKLPVQPYSVFSKLAFNLFP